LVGFSTFIIHITSHNIHTLIEDVVDVLQGEVEGVVAINYVNGGDEVGRGKVLEVLPYVI